MFAVEVSIKLVLLRIELDEPAPLPPVEECFLLVVVGVVETLVDTVNGVLTVDDDNDLASICWLRNERLAVFGSPFTTEMLTEPTPFWW